MHRGRRALIVSTGLLLLLGLLCVPAHGAARTTLTAATVPARIAGESTVISGRVNGGKRALQLRRYDRGAWRIFKRATAAGGRYRFTLAAPATTRSYRVVAPKKRGYSARTITVPVRVVAQKGVITAPAEVVIGTTAVATARFSPARPGRSVYVQRWTGAAWVRHATTTQSAQGIARASLPTGTVGRTTYRMMTVLAKGAKSALTPSVSVSVVTQSSTITVPDQVVRDATATVTGTFSPARSGRPVYLERATGSTWTRVRTASQNTRGEVSLALPTAAVGEATYRLVAATVTGAPAVTTNEVRTTVVAAPVAIDGVAPGQVLSGEVTIRGTASADLGASAEVFLHAGGNQIGHAVVDNGAWSVTVDTASLENGSTDLVALAKGPGGSGVSDAVNVKIDNGTGWPADASGFRVDVVTSGLDLPTSFARIDEHRTLITEKTGKVRLMVDGQLRPTPALDLSGAVATDGDLGLIGIALAPDFTDSGHVFLHVTPARTAADDIADPTGQKHAQQVVRYTLEGETLSPASRHVVLGRATGADCFQSPATTDCLPTMASSHTGGDLLFLPDGSLAVTMGDGILDWNDLAAKLRVQDPDILTGKILRIDPETGRGVPGNPLYSSDQPDSNRGRVAALGLRNPFRLSLTPEGDLAVADVGEFSVEEVNRIPAARLSGATEPVNLGWPCFEGTFPVAADNSTCAQMHAAAVKPLMPALQYGHVDWRGSVTGGFVYTGTSWPAEYRNRYLFGDYTFAKIWARDLPAAGQTDTISAADAPTFVSGVAAGGPVKFGMGDDGDVWFLSITTGELRSIVHDPNSEGCSAERFRVEYFANDSFDGTPALVSCERALPTDNFTLPMGVAQDEFSVRWTGQPRMAAGPYSVTRSTAGSMRLFVNGDEVADGFSVQSPDLADPAPEVKLELTGSGASDDDFSLQIQPVGTPPAVTLSGLPQGQRIASGASAAFTATATHDGAPVPADDVRIRIRQLHFNGSGTAAHSHYVLDREGGSASFAFDDTHEPGSMAFQVQAFATGPEGTHGASAPLIVCLDGNRVGPCR